ncbi:MAG: response regulator transcription factor [Candidatus Acidiferrales bacterium]
MKSRILVADDNPLIRKMLCELFANHAYLEICDEAVNGQDAVEKARRLRPDLVILDFSMPIMNGLQAAREICKVLPTVPIILFTMFAHAIELSEATTPGVTRVVSKNEASTVVGHAEELLQVA